MTTTDLFREKKSIRAEMCKRLAVISTEMRMERSRALIADLVKEPFWHNARTVLAFHSLPDEPDLLSLWSLSSGKILCLPKMVGNTLQAYAVRDLSALTSGASKVIEPDPTRHTFVAVEDIDLILVPGLAFTHGGHRLGRGGGFYDRFLSNPKVRAVRCGVAFACQLMPLLPMELHDVELDKVLAA